MTTGVFVGVIPNDCDVRQTLIDPPIEACESGGDLVNRSMQIVDPRLQRHREIDHIAARPTKHVLLGIACTRDLQPRSPRKRQPTDANDESGDGNDGCGSGADVHSGYGSEKMTGYWAELFALFFSPGTVATSTRTVVAAANGTRPRSVNVTGTV